MRKAILLYILFVCALANAQIHFHPPGWFGDGEGDIPQQQFGILRHLYSTNADPTPDTSIPATNVGNLNATTWVGQTNTTLAAHFIYTNGAYIDTWNSDDFDVMTSEWTIAVAVDRDNDDANEGIIVKSSTNGSVIDWSIAFTTNGAGTIEVRIYDTNNTSYIGRSAPDFNMVAGWHLIWVEKSAGLDPTDIAIYLDRGATRIDDTSVTNGVVTELKNSDARIWFGAARPAVNTISGALDDPTIWCCTMTVAERETYFWDFFGTNHSWTAWQKTNKDGLQTNLLAACNFEQAKVNSTDPVGNHGTNGPGGSAMLFDSDGTNGYAVLAGNQFCTFPNVFPTNNNPRTVAFWFRQDAVANDGMFDYARNSAGKRFSISTQLLNGTNTLHFSPSGSVWGFPFTTDTNWHHLAVVVPSGAVNMSDVEMYLDAVDANPVSLLGGDRVLDTQLGTTIPYFGAGIGGINPFNGDLDELRVFDIGLSAAQVSNLWEASNDYHVP